MIIKYQKVLWILVGWKVNIFNPFALFNEALLLVTVYEIMAQPVDFSHTA